jgi:hypothetical protein
MHMFIFNVGSMPCTFSLVSKEPSQAFETLYHIFIIIKEPNHMRHYAYMSSSSNIKSIDSLD